MFALRWAVVIETFPVAWMNDSTYLLYWIIGCLCLHFPEGHCFWYCICCHEMYMQRMPQTMALESVHALLWSVPAFRCEHHLVWWAKPLRMSRHSQYSRFWLWAAVSPPLNSGRGKCLQLQTMAKSFSFWEYFWSTRVSALTNANGILHCVSLFVCLGKNRI